MPSHTAIGQWHCIFFNVDGTASALALSSHIAFLLSVCQRSPVSCDMFCASVFMVVWGWGGGGNGDWRWSGGYFIPKLIWNEFICFPHRMWWWNWFEKCSSSHTFYEQMCDCVCVCSRRETGSERVGGGGGGPKMIWFRSTMLSLSPCQPKLLFTIKKRQTKQTNVTNISTRKRHINMYDTNGAHPDYRGSEVETENKTALEN